jgi:hypothetical protein
VRLSHFLCVNLYLTVSLVGMESTKVVVVPTLKVLKENIGAAKRIDIAEMLPSIHMAPKVFLEFAKEQELSGIDNIHDEDIIAVIYALPSEDYKQMSNDLLNYLYQLDIESKTLREKINKDKGAIFVDLMAIYNDVLQLKLRQSEKKRKIQSITLSITSLLTIAGMASTIYFGIRK